MVEFVRFPAVTNASKEGLLAMGGELSVDTLVSAYSQGIFPWFSHDQPILWWSPAPRMVLYPADVRVSRSLRKKLRQGTFRVTCDSAFTDVIRACALRGQQNPNVPKAETWITRSMADAYTKLHQRHYAHSIEVWLGDELVGGLYGVVLGNVFFGESMFSRTSDASKVGFVALCRWLQKLQFSVIDCQVASDHLFSLGAVEIPRQRFLEYLQPIDILKESENFSKGFERFVQDNVITAV